MRLGIIMLLCVAIDPLSAATYYIDFDGGSDSNNGTSTSTPWKRHPWMANEAVTYTANAGDRFIFKGGVIWTNSFPLDVAVSGGTATRYYHGVDAAWFTGGAWARPIFEGNSNSVQFIELGSAVSNHVFDSMEMRNHRNNAAIFATSPRQVTLTNLYIHKWWKGTATVDGQHGGIYNNYAGVANGTLADFLITHCTIDNSDGGANWGVCVRGAGELAFSKLGYAPELLLHGGYSVHDNEFYHCTESANGDDEQHPNVAYLDNFNGSVNLPSGSSIYFYNNYIHDIRSGNSVQIIYPNMGTGGFASETGNFYCYNNVVLGVSNARLVPIDNFGGGAASTFRFWFWNNTFENATGDHIGVVFRSGVDGPDRIELKNNHFIGAASIYDDGGYSITTVQGHNLTNTVAAANTAGFYSVNYYAPTNASAVTVNTGTNVLASLPSQDFDTSLGNLRTPAARVGATIDKGAFEFVTQGGGEGVAGAIATAIPGAGQVRGRRFSP